MEVSRETDFTHSPRPDVREILLYGTVSISRVVSTNGSAFQKERCCYEHDKIGNRIGTLRSLSDRSRSGSAAHRPEWPSSCHNDASYRETYAVSYRDHRGVSFADASKVMAPYKQWMIGANKTG